MLKRYTVEIYEATKRFVYVEANSKAEAESLALNGDGKETYRKVIESETEVFEAE